MIPAQIWNNTEINEWNISPSNSLCSFVRHFLLRLPHSIVCQPMTKYAGWVYFGIDKNCQPCRIQISDKPITSLIDFEVNIKWHMWTIIIYHSNLFYLLIPPMSHPHPDVFISHSHDDFFPEEILCAVWLSVSTFPFISFVPWIFLFFTSVMCCRLLLIASVRIYITLKIELLRVILAYPTLHIFQFIAP